MARCMAGGRYHCIERCARSIGTQSQGCYRRSDQRPLWWIEDSGGQSGGACPSLYDLDGPQSAEGNPMGKGQHPRVAVVRRNIFSDSLYQNDRSALLVRITDEPAAAYQ